MQMRNSYEDQKRADAYSALEFPGTYYLAYRDLPEIFKKHARGRRALDFGCGTGRSTRFVRDHGYLVVGVDIAKDMLVRARELDPEGDYHLVEDGDLSALALESFDLVLSAFTFDNIPTEENKVRLLRALGGLLGARGRIVNLVSNPEIYFHEWASFSTKDYPENRQARSREKVRIIITDIDDKRPVEDVLWTEADYHHVYSKAGLEVVDTYRPLATGREGIRWVNETRLPPWRIDVLSQQKDR